jgi:hypothetical protein
MGHAIDPIAGAMMHGQGTEQLLARTKPDAVVSVVPMGNGAVWERCKRDKIPFAILPTDLGIQRFVAAVHDADEHFYVGAPFDEPSMRGAVPSVLHDHYVATGYPVRPAFSAAIADVEGLAATQDALRAELGIEPGEPVVMVMMGAQGAAGTLVADDARLLAEGLRDVDGRVHVLCMCSGNASLQRAAVRVSLENDNPHVRVHALGKQDGGAMAALMAMSRALITKPGGSTVNEALALNLPMLFRKMPERAIGGGPWWTFGAFRAPELDWERDNREWVEALPAERFEGGASVKMGQEVDEHSLVDAIRAALQAPRPVLKDVPARAFESNVRALLARMLPDESEQERPRAPG